MAKKSEYAEGATAKEKKSFARYMAEDEELIIATGYGKTFLRHRFVYFVMLPGMIFWILGGGIAWFLKQNIGYGLLLGMAFSFFTAYLQTLLLFHSHRYLLTTRRVLVKDGFFSVKLGSALYDKITHIEVEQSFFDRLIMHHGTVIINTAGMNKIEMKLENVEAPIEFKNILERLINREREVHGRPTGSITAVEGEIIDD